MAVRAEPRELVGTIVFTDLVGFTEFTALQGDAEALALLARQDDVVRERHPRRVPASSRSSATACCSGSPSPVDALRSSLELQCRFDAESDATGLPMWVRIGMHHGKALARGDDLVGHDVNLAARIVDLAGPGEVLLSEPTKADIGDELPGVSFDELGPVVMKGIPTPVRLWRAELTVTSVGLLVPRRA